MLTGEHRCATWKELGLLGEWAEREKEKKRKREREREVVRESASRLPIDCVGVDATARGYDPVKRKCVDKNEYRP